jgi:hypothetical protein
MAELTFQQQDTFDILKNGKVTMQDMFKTIDIIIPDDATTYGIQRTEQNKNIRSILSLRLFVNGDDNYKGVVHIASYPSRFKRTLVSKIIRTRSDFLNLKQLFDNYEI